MGEVPNKKKGGVIMGKRELEIAEKLLELDEEQIIALMDICVTLLKGKLKVD